MTPNRPPRAVAYIRVSQEREDMISPELQETAIRDHCMRRGYDLVEVITDLDLSGRFWKRRQMERAVTMIEHGDVEVIVVWKMSRVSRNRLDWSIALDRVETAGGRLESATEPIDATTSSGRFSRGILAELAAFESERAGEQWQEALRRRWRRGLPHSGRARFGYTYDRDIGFVVDPVAAPIVRELYARYIGGEGREKLALWMQQVTAGMTNNPPRTAHGISNFMGNGFAAGYITHHDPECQGPHPPGLKECPNKIQERGIQEPIVDEDTYRDYLAEQQRRSTLPPRLLSPVSELSGILICVACGARMARHAAGGHRKSAYFRCPNPKRRACPAPTTVIESVAIDAVRAWLPTVADDVTSEARRIPARASMRALEQMQLDRVATQAEQALTKLTMDYARGMIPDDAYQSARAALERERDDAAREVGALRNATMLNAERGMLAVDLMEAWEVLSPAARNRILRLLCVVHIQRGEPRIRVRGLWE